MDLPVSNVLLVLLQLEVQVLVPPVLMELSPMLKLPLALNVSLDVLPALIPTSVRPVNLLSV